MRITFPFIRDYIRESTMTTQGDVIKRGPALPERLGIGNVGDSLKVKSDGTEPEWKPGSDVLTTMGDILTHNGIGIARLPKGTSRSHLRIDSSGNYFEYVPEGNPLGAANDLMSHNGSNATRIPAPNHGHHMFLRLTQYNGGVSWNSIRWLYAQAMTTQMTLDCIQIFAWNMDSTPSIIVNIGSGKTIVLMNIMIRRDIDFAMSPLISAVGATSITGSYSYNPSTGDIQIERVTGGQYDNINYNDPIMNRGYIFYLYFN